MKRLLAFTFMPIILLSCADSMFAQAQVQPSGSFVSQEAQGQSASNPQSPREVKPDPSGANTGGTDDVVGASANASSADELKAMAAKEPLAAKLADVVGHNRVAVNFVWTLGCGFLVMFMQAGFAMAEQVAI